MPPTAASAISKANAASPDPDFLATGSFATADSASGFPGRLPIPGRRIGPGGCAFVRLIFDLVVHSALGSLDT